MSKYYSFLIMIGLAASVQAQNLDGAWKGVLQAGPQKLNIVFNFKKADNGKFQCTMDSPDQGAKGIPATVSVISTDSFNVEIPSLRVRYDGKLGDDKIKGTFNQAGMKFDLNLTKGALVKIRPQTPVAPFSYKTEEVFFTNEKDLCVMSGSLTYPAGYEKMNKKDVPVVLMVSGSGSQNRDEEIFDHSPFLVIADYLAKNGIASLRYDDR
ncbi:MAG: alpha/beta hydrolase, partial [Bacteroidales bacterium]